MSRAPSHDPSEPPPTDWRRLAIGLIGLLVGLTLIFIGLRTF